MEQRPTLTIALAVHNEEENLPSCLLAVKGIADEIVVVDGASTDKTIDVARSLGAKVIEENNPPIFHINKQIALDNSKSDWILQLDADEIVPLELKLEIQEILKKSHTSKTNGYFLPRKNFFLGHWMKKGGQYPDYVMRLVKNGTAKFPCKSVHEQIEVKGKKGYTKEALLHYSYKSLNEYWKKAETYTSLTAKELYEAHVKLSFRNACTYYLFKPLQTFFLLFIRHKGIYDGIYGFMFAAFSGWHFVMAYRKLIRLYRTNA